MMKKKKRYLPPYIEFSEIEEDIDMLADSGSQEETGAQMDIDNEDSDDDDSRQAKSSNFLWDTDDSKEW